MSDPRLLGLPADFTFEGKTYPVSPRTFAVEAAFRRWLERQAFQRLKMSKDLMDELEWNQALAGWRQECATGVYAYPMPLCIHALCSVEGAKQMTFLVLAAGKKSDGPDVSEALVERIFADDEKWEELRLLREGLDDPNRQAPGKEVPPAQPPAAST